MKAFLLTFKGAFCTLVLTLICWTTASAQRIGGLVLDQDTREVLPGATVAVQGSSRGTITDANGRFQIDAQAGDTLLVSYVGYASQTVVVGTDPELIVKLSTSSELQTVVVTALGINKEKDRLGYATQEVKGAELVKAREPNPVSALTGKVAGLTVGASPELLGAPALNLRGAGAPIFVVDGVPINSDTWNISPDDIESYQVLKGPAAAALYGVRSQNGVIMITTKKGTRDRRGVSVEFNSSQMLESGFNAIPKVQFEYGPGDHGRYYFVDGRGGGANDGDYDIWGPRFEGQLITQYDSPLDASTPELNDRIPTPWIARGVDNLQRFLRPGFLSTNNIAVSASSEMLDMRYSTTYGYQQGMAPNTELNILNFNVYGGLKFSQKVKLEANINYNRQFTENFPDIQYGPNSMIYNIIIWGGADWDIEQLRDYWQPGREGIQQNYAEYQRYNNPWFLAYEWLRGHYKTDIYGQTALTWNIMAGLNLKVRTAVTTYDLFRSEKFPYSATVYGREEARGDYREDKRTLFDNNTDIFLQLDRNIGANFNVNAIAGGALRSFRYSSNYTTTNYLNVPGLYNFTNTANPLYATNFNSQMIVQSGFYSLDLGLRNFLTLSHTGRVDHLSTLPEKNNTFFYPSVGLSVIPSELVELGPFSYVKLRASYANVKGGLTTSYIGPTPGAAYPVGYGSQYHSSYEGPSFENSSVYNSPIVYDGQPGSYFTNTITNPNLSPFSRTNYEAGLEARLLRNLVTFDVTYFQYIDGPRIFAKQISEASGYTTQLINAVKTQNKGWEITVSASPLKNPRGFSWNVSANWSTWRETYLELPEGVDRIYDFYQEGDRTDGFYGRAFYRTPDGQIINDDGGRPIYNPVAQKLGYSNPDWVWSVINKVSWKNLTLGFQFDGRVGGVMANYIQQQTFRGGRHIATTEGAMGEARYQDWLVQQAYFQALDAGENPDPLDANEDGHWLGEGMVVSNGVTIEYDPVTGAITNYDQLQFANNTTRTWLQDYISRYYNSAEGNLMSKTFSKLREVTVTWEAPKRWFEGSRIAQSASVSLVGRNLLYFAEKKDIDLDNYIGSNYSGLQSPTAKRYGININLTF